MKSLIAASVSSRGAGSQQHARRLLRPTVLLLLAAVLGTASGCARHGSLQKKTRWYKSHAGKTTPCPCGH